MKAKQDKSKRNKIIKTIVFMVLAPSLLMLVIGMVNMAAKNAQSLEDLKVKHEAELELVKEDSYLLGKEDGISLAKAEQEKLSNKPFKPELLLSARQAQACLALAVYGEARGESPLHREIVAWSVINRAIDERNTAIYKNTVCAVVAAKGQYDAMVPYIGAVKNIVWGDAISYIPNSARGVATKDSKAWDEINVLVASIIEGKRSRKTLANHFYSPSAASKNVAFPKFLAYMKPLAPAGKHLMYVDYVTVDGKKIYLTKEKPYNPLIHG